MGRAAYASFCGVLARDGGAGRVRVTRDGTPRVHYKVNEGDARRMTDAVIAAGKVLEAAGANEIFKPHEPARLISYRPGLGAHERWAEEIRRVGADRGSWTFASWHQMGSCRMGVDPATSVVDGNNESHEVSGLFVTDGSTFPNASGVNPMLSIYGIANRAAKKISERLS
jgi:choline dehydrogenase-like flavoprotein